MSNLAPLRRALAQLYVHVGEYQGREHCAPSVAQSSVHRSPRGLEVFHHQQRGRNKLCFTKRMKLWRGNEVEKAVAIR